MSGQALLLLAALLVAHYLGDFTPLANARMQKAKADGGPLLPILGHAAVHAVLVALAVLLVARPPASVVLIAGGIELGAHFVIDAARARIGLRVPVLGNPLDNPFWWALGLDQLLHGLVLLGIARLVLDGAPA